MAAVRTYAQDSAEFTRSKVIQCIIRGKPPQNSGAGQIGSTPFGQGQPAIQGFSAEHALG